MHDSSYQRMKGFAERLPSGSKVLDVGSRDVNGTSMIERRLSCRHICHCRVIEITMKPTIKAAGSVLAPSRTWMK